MKTETQIIIKKEIAQNINQAKSNLDISKLKEEIAQLLNLYILEPMHPKVYDHFKIYLLYQILKSNIPIIYDEEQDIYLIDSKKIRQNAWRKDGELDEDNINYYHKLSKSKNVPGLTCGDLVFYYDTPDTFIEYNEFFRNKDYNSRKIYKYIGSDLIKILITCSYIKEVDNDPPEYKFPITMYRMSKMYYDKFDDLLESKYTLFLEKPLYNEEISEYPNKTQKQLKI